MSDEYWLLNTVFLAVAVVVAALAVIVRHRRMRATAPFEDTSPATRERFRLKSMSCVVAVLVLLVMTAVFDNVMIGVGLVGYDVSKITRVFIGVAPLEDFSYTVGALILLPSVWSLLGALPRRGGAAALESEGERR